MDHPICLPGLCCRIATPVRCSPDHPSTRRTSGPSSQPCGSPAGSGTTKDGGIRALLLQEGPFNVRGVALCLMLRKLFSILRRNEKSCQRGSSETAAWWARWRIEGAATRPSSPSSWAAAKAKSALDCTHEFFELNWRVPVVSGPRPAAAGSLERGTDAAEEAAPGPQDEHRTVLNFVGGR